MVRLGILLPLLAWPAAADEPLPPPSNFTAYSLNRGCCAYLDASRKMTTIFQETKDGARTQLWAMPGWFRVVALSDDCEHLVTGFDGSNLLPLDFMPHLLMLSFYERGRLVRAVKLNELIRDLTKLRRTASHYYWGRYLGFDEQHRYVVETVEGRRLAFDPATGRELAGPR